MFRVTVSCEVALAETITLKMNTTVTPAPTDAADGTVTVTSFDEEVREGVTVSASWPEFAIVIWTAPMSPANTLPLQTALRESVEVVQDMVSDARSPVTVARLIESGSLTVSVVVTD